MPFQYHYSVVLELQAAGTFRSPPRAQRSIENKNLSKSTFWLQVRILLKLSMNFNIIYLSKQLVVLFVSSDDDELCVLQTIERRRKDRPEPVFART